MPRFFVERFNITEDKFIAIPAPDAVHIGRSLRMRLGDNITVCCEGYEYDCKILTISDSSVECEVLSKARGEGEPTVSVTLFQAMPKSDKLEFIVQKATELGVSKIVPVITERCISRPNKKGFDKKLARLNKIALEAAKQCGRCIIPTVEQPVKFSEMEKLVKSFDKKLFCYEKGGVNLKTCGLDSVENIAVLIGCEGGFSESEAAECENMGFAAISLGSRILRCETAPVSALSIIMNLTDNM